MMKVMDVTEAKEGRLMELDIRNAGMSQETVDDFNEMNRRAYQVLISRTKEEAKNNVCNPERSGFKAWTQMVRHIMQTWGQEVAEFEMKFAEKIDEDAKILALKSAMPDTLFGEAGVFRGRSFNFYADLRTAVINSLDVIVSMMKQGPPISTTNMVQTGIKENKEKTER